MADPVATLRIEATATTLPSVAAQAKQSVDQIGVAAKEAGRASELGLGQVTQAVQGTTAGFATASQQARALSLQSGAVTNVLKDMGATGSNAGRAMAQQLGAASSAANSLAQSGSKAAAGLDQVERSGKNANGRLAELLRLGGQIAGISIGVATVRQVAQLVDGYTNLNSKLSLVAANEADVTRVREQLFAVSQRTRTEFAATGELYTRLTRATADLGLSEQKRLTIVESINQALVISGATQQESSAALIQLSQALASGVLRGEEFNSIAEQAPIILDLLSSSLGKSRGELRAMAEQGLLTSEVLVGSLLEGASGLEGQFNKMALTIGGASTQLFNAIKLYVGGASDALGVSTAIALAISTLAAAFAPLANVIALVGLAWGVKYVAGLLSARAAAAAARVATIDLTNAQLREALTAEAAAAAQLAHAQAIALMGGRASAAVAAENALAAAQTRTAAAATAAAAAQAANVGVLARLGSGLSALVGGPIGLAVLGFGAVALGLNYLSNQSAAAVADLARTSVEMREGAKAAQELATGLQSAAAAPPALSASIERLTSNAALIADARTKIAEAQAELADLEDRNARQIARFGLGLTGIEEARAEVAKLQAEFVALTGETDNLADQLVGRFAPALDIAGAAATRLLAQTNAVGAFDALLDGVTDVVAAVSRISSADVEAGRLFKQISAGSAKAAEDLKVAGKSASQVAQELVNLALSRAEDANWTEQQLQAMRDQGAAYVANLVAIDKAKNATKDLAAAKREQEKADREYRRSIDENIKAEERRIAAIDRERAQLDQLRIQLLGPVAAAEAEYRQQVEATIQALFRGQATREHTIELLGLQAQAYERTARAAAEEERQQIRSAQIVERTLEGLQFELGALQQTAKERAIEAVLLEASSRAREQYNKYQRDSINLTPAEVAAIRERGGALIDQIDATNEAQERAGQLSTSLSDSIGRAVTAGIFHFDKLGDVVDDLGDALVNTFERAIGDIISEFARLQVVNPLLNQLLGTNLQTGGGGILGSLLGGSGTGAGGTGGILGSLLSGNGIPGLGGTLGRLFGGSGAPGGGIGANFVGPLQPGTSAPGSSALGTAGQAFGFAAGAYGVYSAYRTGSPLSGAASGAAAGSVFGPVGAIVGGIVGALAGILGGPKPPDLRLGAPGQTRKPEQRFTTELGVLELGARGLEGGEEQFKKPVQEFDATLAAIIRMFGNGQDQLDLVQQRLSTWSVDLKDSAISVDAVLGSRFSATLGTFTQEIQSFVGTTGDIATRVQRLADAAFIDAAAQSGDLLDSFGGLVRVLESARLEGESIQDTYTRVWGATILLDEATALMGLTLAGSREEFVLAATEIAAAAGGLEQASALWSNYFDTFYTDAERAQAALERAEEARNAALASLGLSADTSVAQFRAAFEREFPNLTAEQRVQWLEAGVAIRTANDAQAEYNATLGQSDDAADDAREAIASVLGSLAAFGEDLNRQFVELDRAGLNDFQRRILSIDDDLKDNVAQLLRWEGELRQAGASAEELAQVSRLLGRAQALAAEQTVAAIRALRAAGQSLVQQLYGDDDSSLGNAAQTFADAGTQAFEQIGQAASDTYESQLRGIRSIQEYLDAQLLGDLSTLTAAERFAEAQRQFSAAVLAAQGGDPEALQAVTRLADVLLREGRTRFAGGPEFDALEASIRAALTGLLGVATGTPGGGGVPGATGFSGSINNAVSEFGTQAQTNRLELATQLTAIIRDLISATGDSLTTVADSLNLNLTSLVGDLGVNLGELTAATTVNLGNIAGSLGVELTDLARSVGVDLGSLADSQSLLNQALEAQIAALPQSQRDRLQPLLDAVEEAARTGGPERVNTAIRALEDETRRIGGQAALALAPYLDEIDPVDALVGIDQVLRQGFVDEAVLLNNIYAAIVSAGAGSAAATPTPIPVNPTPIPIGTAMAPDKNVVVMVSPVIVPAGAFAGAGSTPQVVVDALLREMKATREELIELRRQVARGDEDNVQATREAARVQAKATEEQTNVLKSARTT